MNANAITQAIRSASVEELEQIRELTQAELEQRKRRRREEAMAEIRRIAETENIPVRFDAKSRPKKSAKAPLYKSGRSYRHPTDETLVWKANGQKPGWLRELEKEGGRAVEIPVSEKAAMSARKE
jgi:hypothetical protein